MAYLTPIEMPKTVMIIPILLERFSPMNFSRLEGSFGKDGVGALGRVGGVMAAIFSCTISSFFECWARQQ